MSRIILFRSPLTAAAFAKCDDGDSVLVLTDTAVAAATDDLLDAIARRISFSAALVTGRTSHRPLAAALLTDWVVAEETARLSLADSAEVAAAVVLRVGRKALSLLVVGGTELTAGEAYAAGLVDSLVAPETDPVKWAREWVGSRSIPALTSGASLIRRRGGDRVERAEFARLFAVGEPQRGLEQFLSKRRPDPGLAPSVEIV